MSSGAARPHDDVKELTMTHDTIPQEIELLELGRRWARAEVEKDLPTLEAMAHPDLRLVGPLGFILDRQAWLERYQPGRLDTTELVWDQVEVRLFGDTAVMVGRQSQRVTFQGRPNDGDFRITHVLVRDPSASFGWLIAHVQLSQLVTPPGAPAGPTPGGPR
jgi:hypothetical protein